MTPARRLPRPSHWKAGTPTTAEAVGRASGETSPPAARPEAAPLPPERLELEALLLEAMAARATEQPRGGWLGCAGRCSAWQVPLAIVDKMAALPTDAIAGLGVDCGALRGLTGHLRAMADSMRERCCDDGLGGRGALRLALTA